MTRELWEKTRDLTMFEGAFRSVAVLVEQFTDNQAHYLSAQYQEAEVRKDFIDKFWKILGWDVDHEREFDPWRQEVKIERPDQKAKGRADYAFSIAPQYKRVRFFVEAKRPQQTIASPDNCFQAIRYSWPKGVPIAVLMDFNYLHIVDSRYRPDINTATSRVARSWHCTEYKERDKFAELYWLLSREAVATGSIENFADNELPEPETAIRQYTLFPGEIREFDDTFLQQLDTWRNVLASNFKSARADLNGAQLTECVQRTLDRLLFIRFLEDKLIEPDRIVDRFGAKGRTHWKDFVTACARLDKEYNGIVFKRHSILDDAQFHPDGGVFSDICDYLSDPHSPYNFDSIPVEILGRIYERFLGKIVRLRGRGVTVEDKPNVRKAGGVYYTPDYIVAYIAENALEPLIKGKKPNQLLDLRIVDTACGSGSFLIGAYSYLLQAVARYWLRAGKEASKGLVEEREGHIHLTLKYRREILVKCIFGVDIDPQAVEVAQLSLYLKLLEEETTYSARQQQREIGAALLPSLTENVLNANSLLDSTERQDLFDSINFRVAFKGAFSKGGFDLVIGNPPYIKEYTNRSAFNGVRHSPYYQGKMDIWYLFASLAIDWLRPTTGTLAYIATNNWITNAGAKRLREKICAEMRIAQLVDFGSFMVFRDAAIQTMILIARKDSSLPTYDFDYRRLIGREPTQADAQALLEHSQSASCHYLTALFDRKRQSKAPFTFASGVVEALLRKIEERGNFKFDGRLEIAQGIVAPQDFLNKKGQAQLGPQFRVGQGIFVLSDEEKKRLRLTNAELTLLKPYYTTTELRRYFAIARNAYWVIYTDSQFRNPESMSSYPNLRSHLDQFASVVTSHNAPYGLHRARVERFFNGPKILALRKCAQPTFTYTEFPCYVSQTFNILQTARLDMRFLTGLLNSRLVRFWLRHKGKMQGHHFQVDKEPLLSIPIFAPDEDTQKKLGERIATMRGVSNREDLHSATDAEKMRLDTITGHLDADIQERIEALYGLDSQDCETLARSDRGEFDDRMPDDASEEGTSEEAIV